MKKNLLYTAVLSLAAILCTFAVFGFSSCDTASVFAHDGSGNSDKRLPPPELNSVRTDGAKVYLDWKAVDGADEYCVYYAQGEKIPSGCSDGTCRTSTGCQLVLDILPGPGIYTGYIIALQNKVAGYQGNTWTIKVYKTTYPPFEETCSFSNGYIGSGYELGVGYDPLTDSTGPDLFSAFETASYILRDSGVWRDYSFFCADQVSASLIMLQETKPFSIQGGVTTKRFFPDAKAIAFLKNLMYAKSTFTVVSYMRIQYEYRVPMLLCGTFVEDIVESPYPAYVRETKKGLEVFFLYQLQTDSRYSQAETKISLERLIENKYRASITYTEEERAKDLAIVRADGNSVKSFAYSNLSLPGVENIRSYGDYQDYIETYYSLDKSSRVESLGLVEATFFQLSENPGPHSSM